MSRFKAVGAMAHLVRAMRKTPSDSRRSLVRTRDYVEDDFFPDAPGLPSAGLSFSAGRGCSDQRRTASGLLPAADKCVRIRHSCIRAGRRLSGAMTRSGLSLLSRSSHLFSQEGARVLPEAGDQTLRRNLNCSLQEKCGYTRCSRLVDLAFCSTHQRSGGGVGSRRGLGQEKN